MNLQENIQFRIDLHKLLCDDIKLQNIFLEMCRYYKPILFNSVFFTFNPKKRINSPFNLRPHQIPAVVTLDDCIQTGHDVGINKSREEGASEICCKLFAANCLLYEYNNFIVGSRKEDLVDHAGDPTTLFAKVDNVFNCLPFWWKKLCGYDPSIHRKNLILEIPMMSSSIVGETTNESFSAGSRATAMLLDEFGRVDHSVAESIEGSVHDVTDCVIYSSTHWLGVNHPFNNALKKESTTVVELMWYGNPEKNKGLYTSPEPGKIEILDTEYYRTKDLQNAVYCSNINQYSLNTKQVQFVADGGCGLPPKVKNVRSPWHDAEEKKRKGNKRDFVCNVWGCPLGASDAPFDANVLEEIKNKYICPPVFEGELEFSFQHDTIDKDNIEFNLFSGEKRLKWWGELSYGRPNQRHNYIIGIDPSYGLGSANSAAIIIDVNLKEQVGSWVDSSTKPEQFADVIVALSYWIGGVDDPFLIWESNAGCGKNFEQRILYHHYFHAYTQRREDSKTRKRVQKWGWASNENAKEKLLGELGVALSGGLAGDTDYLSLIIHDEELLKELSDYVFREKGKGIVSSSKADLSTGAMERHGDRGIAAGLCVLGMKEQGEGNIKNLRKAPVGSFEHYRQELEKQQAKDRRENRRFLFE